MPLDKSQWDVSEDQQLFHYPDGEGNIVAGDPLDIDERSRLCSPGGLNELLRKAYPKPIDDPRQVPILHPETKEVIGHGPKMVEVFKRDADGNVVKGPDGKPIMEQERATIAIPPAEEDREAFYGMVCHAFRVKRLGPKLGSDGKPVKDADGNPVMVGNTKAALHRLWQNFHEYGVGAQKKPDEQPTSSVPTVPDSSTSSLPPELPV